MAALGLGVGHVEVVEGYILDDGLLLVDVSLGERDVLLGLEVVLRGVDVGTADSLDVAGLGLDVDDISNSDFLLLDVLVGVGVQSQLLGALGTLKSDNNGGDHLPVPPMGVLLLLRSQLGDFTLQNLLGLLNFEADCPAEVLIEDFCLLDLGGVHLGADHGAEGHLGAQLLGDSQGDGGLAGAGRPGHQQGAPCHRFSLDHVHDDAGTLPGLVLADQTRVHVDGSPLLVQSQPLDVAVGRDSLSFGHTLDFFYFHFGVLEIVTWICLLF